MVHISRPIASKRFTSPKFTDRGITFTHHRKDADKDSFVIVSLQDRDLTYGHKSKMQRHMK